MVRGTTFHSRGVGRVFRSHRHAPRAIRPPGSSRPGPAARPPGKVKAHMAFTIDTKVLSYEGAQAMLAAGIAKATEMKVPQCISIVDTGGHLLAFARMDGAFALS